ncbi:MAG: hypothetical protein N2651_01650, partial [Fimbriimonadales bacterium]|nr:hypothetical protein [Fimbriimonadales bacterium]
MNTKRELPHLWIGQGGRANRADALRLESILPHLQRVQRLSSGEWLACCPAHDDREPSLSLRELADGTLLWHCHAGCSQEQVGEALRKLAGVDTRRREPARRGLTLQEYARAKHLPIDWLR